MHCVSAYPCNSENINLPRINHLRKYFKNVGFSDHTQGIKTTISSLIMNPVAIEKHFTIDKNLPGRDNKFAILPNEMKFLNEYIIEMNNALIDHGLEYQSIETQSREFYGEDLMDDISIIIRCNNEERWIGHTIQSCLDLIEYPEIIIVNDNSTDSSLKIARMFNHEPTLERNRKYSDVKIINIDDYTPGKAINLGVKMLTMKQ